MKQASHYTYILECADKTYYIGKTNNLEKRLRQHNGEIKGGAKYTRSRRPVELKYTEACESLGKALQKEIELKKLSHEKKALLIKNDNSKDFLHPLITI